jgi:two-component system cell cycle sensor histidine kinase/response regulator CckA
LTDITSLREAEAARNASDERLRLITETVREVFYLLEVDPLRMVYVSSAFEQIWGRSAAELACDGVPGVPGTGGVCFADTIHPDDRARVADEVARRIAGEEVSSEYRIVRPDGEVRWIADRSWPLFGPDGAVQRIVGSAEDITERKLASERLRRSEEQLSRILETVADGIVIIDHDGQITFANRAAEELLGLSRPTITSRTFNHPEWRITSAEGGPFPDADLPAARVLERGEAVFGVEHAVERPDGRAVLSINAAPLRGASGEVEGVVASLRDVTAAHRAADQLRFQATLLDAVGESVTATDLEGDVTYWNRHAERLSGWPAAEALGRSVLDVVATPETAGDVVRLLSTVAAGEPWAGELEQARRDGSTFPAFVSAAPLLDRAGEVVGMVSASSDLTEVKRLQQQLQQGQRMEAIGRLAGGVAHDFNNILTGIRGYASLVLNELASTDPLRPDVEEIAKAADRAAVLTRQLLAFSRKQALEPQVLDLSEVVGGMERMLSRLIGEDVELEFSCDPELGRVRADPGQLEQVLLNLAVNARDAMPHGGRLRIEVRNVEPPRTGLRGAAPGPHVVLRVSDSGIGIPPAVQPHIFEPFFTTKEVGRGTGLGLSTVYGIVAQSGGRIEVLSKPGAGSTFEVWLPRVDTGRMETDCVSAPGRG